MLSRLVGACGAVLLLTGCDLGPVVAVRIGAPLACAPVVVGDSLAVYAEADRSRSPVVAYSSSRRADAFTWSSSAPAVVEVTTAGLVRARAPGSAWIAASAEGFRDSTLVRVVASDTTITLAPASPVMHAGDTVLVRATGHVGGGAAFPVAFPHLSVGDDASVVYVVGSSVDGVRLAGVSRGAADLTWSVAGRCGVTHVVVN